MSWCQSVFVFWLCVSFSCWSEKATDMILHFSTDRNFRQYKEGLQSVISFTRCFRGHVRPQAEEDLRWMWCGLILLRGVGGQNQCTGRKFRGKKGSHCVVWVPAQPTIRGLFIFIHCSATAKNPSKYDKPISFMFPCVSPSLTEC